MQVIDDGRDLKIHPPTFSVDNSLGDIPEPLPKQAQFAVFSGPPRSGKTSLAVCLLTQIEPKLYAGVFKKVYLIIPQPSFESLGDDSPFKNHSRVFHTLTPEFLSALQTELETNSKQGDNSLVIIDDFAAELKDQTLRKGLEKLINNRRHIRTSIWVCVQTLKGLPLSTRKLISHIYQFRPSNSREMDNIRDEFSGVAKDEFNSYVRHVWPKNCGAHQFLMIDLANNEYYNRFAKMNIL
jgi:AAA+ ATPase superfamily predicted ATPase